jgi:F-type H+-transporting ATPase subunit b
MLNLILAIQDHAPAAQEHASGPLTVEGGLMIWTILVFAALMLILGKFAWPAILGAVEAREQALERQLAEAARDREQAAALLADAKAQAHGIIAEGRTVAEKERALAVEKTKQEQDDLLARARREIGAERDKAVADLRREAVDLSLAAASKLVEKRLDSDTDRKLVVDFLASLDDKK